MLNSKVEKPGETKEPRQNKWVKIQTAKLQPGCPPFGASITYTFFFFQMEKIGLRVTELISVFFRGRL